MTTSLHATTRAESIARAVLERFLRTGNPSSIVEIASEMGLTPAFVRIAIAAARGVVPGTVLDWQVRDAVRWQVFYPSRDSLRSIIMSDRASRPALVSPCDAEADDPDEVERALTMRDFQ